MNNIILILNKTIITKQSCKIILNYYCGWNVYFCTFERLLTSSQTKESLDLSNEKITQFWNTIVSSKESTNKPQTRIKKMYNDLINVANVLNDQELIDKIIIDSDRSTIHPDFYNLEYIKQLVKLLELLNKQINNYCFN